MFKGRYWTRNKRLVIVFSSHIGTHGDCTGYTLQDDLVRLIWNTNGDCISKDGEVAIHRDYDLMNKVNPQTKDNEVERGLTIVLGDHPISQLEKDVLLRNVGMED